MVITFEGIDGAGKSTQINLLAQYLREQYRTIVVRNPYDSGLTAHPNLSLYAQTLWHLAALRQLSDTIIYPHHKRGGIVLLDRGHGSILAYQGYGNNRYDQLVRIVRYNISDDVRLATTLFIDVDASVGAARSGDSIYRREEGRYMQRVVAGYRSLAHDERWHTLDGNQRTGALHQQIARIVDDNLL